MIRIDGNKVFVDTKTQKALFVDGRLVELSSKLDGQAEQSAEDAGYMEFHIDEYGHLIYERTSNVDHIDFSISNGHLIMEVA